MTEEEANNLNAAFGMGWWTGFATGALATLSVCLFIGAIAEKSNTI
jgi:hypothetical protein